jgi:regulatory protein
VVALDLVTRKPWTRHDLTRRLVRRGAPAEVAEAVAADLTARGYLDDRRFARGWVAARTEGRGLGSRRLRDELLGRGVAPPLVEAALAEVGDEAARARALVQRRLARAGPGPAAARARRLSAYLLRRGFPAGVVRDAVREASGLPAGEAGADA